MNSVLFRLINIFKNVFFSFLSAGFFPKNFLFAQKIMALAPWLCTPVYQIDFRWQNCCVVVVVDSAIVRSVIKNFSLAFFFPVCLTVFFFTHNRTGYDIISGSIVVELPDDDLWAAIQQPRRWYLLNDEIYWMIYYTGWSNILSDTDGFMTVTDFSMLLVSAPMAVMH